MAAVNCIMPCLPAAHNFRSTNAVGNALPRAALASRLAFSQGPLPNRLTAQTLQQRARTSRLGCTPVAASSLSELKSKFDIPGSVEVTEGQGSLPVVVLKHSCGSSAEVYLFGGLVGSWKQPSGDEILYIRPDAVFDKSKPISGGIPHCFPQFGPGAMQQHGFARNLDWEISSTSADLQPDEKDPEVELILTDNDYTRSMWPHAFKLVYTVKLHGENLLTDYRVINTGESPFDFTAALHTYIEVVDAKVATVKGLQGCKYLDKVADPTNPTSKQEERELVDFSGPVDSVYLSSDGYAELDVGNGAAVTISSSGWEDTVVWNPWTAMPACYERFVCVENAQTGSAPTVAPGESWRAQTEMAVIDL